MMPRVVCTRLLVTFSMFCGAWLSQCCFASPFGRGSIANPPQEKIDQVTDIVATQWMESYSIGDRDGAGTLNFTTKIKKVQRLAGLKVTGKLDDETKKLFIIPRCGVLEEDDNPQRLNDTEKGGDIKPARRKRFYLQGTYWKKKDLTYRFLSSTPDLPVEVQQAILRKMINKWAEASTLTIREADLSIPDDDVDILISFVRRYHGDPYPFDGRGGTLAHAFYPHNNKGLSGDAHFDDEEDFTTGIPDGINLDWVAVHEFGHSMGLEHSNVRESIMYPWYKGYFENIELTYDDIKGIQALYGKPTPTPATTTRTTATTTKASTTKATTTKTTTTKVSTTKATTTKTTTTKSSTTKATTTKTTTTKASTTKTTTTEALTTRLPVLDICKVDKFDAFVMGTDKKTYVFSGHYFWVLGVRLGVESGPIKITSRWKELKTPISSAYTNWDGRTVFFKGSEYWKYFGYRLEEGPRDITKYGLPSELQNPDAAFIWPGNNQAYFFKEFNYWRYNEVKHTVDDNYPRPISIWALDHSIDSVISWSGNKRTYFFKDFNYWKVYNDSYPISMAPGYPRDITQIWMKCAT